MSAKKAIKAQEKITKASCIQAVSQASAKITKPAHTKESVPMLSAGAREELIVQNRSRARKLARSILRKWHSRLDIEEVDSIVDLSLCEAAQRFNPKMGAGFMTFLFYHLRGNLIRAITTAATVNALPVCEVSALAVNDSENEHVQKKGALTNAVEIANALSGSEVLAPDQALERKELIGISRQARDNLDYLEKEVIERIYMNGEQLLDVAYNLGYSRCHISRIKRKALEALYDGMATLVGQEVLGERPNFDQEDAANRSEKETCRKSTTRRPRSIKAQNIHLQALGR